LGVATSARAQTQQSDTAKQSKVEAQYQDKPKNAQMCATCAYFVPPTSCRRVDGEVHATGWCKNFQVKT
jgi:hypothetical protein